MRQGEVDEVKEQVANYQRLLDCREHQGNDPSEIVAYAGHISDDTHLNLGIRHAE